MRSIIQRQKKINSEVERNKIYGKWGEGSKHSNLEDVDDWTEQQRKYLRGKIELQTNPSTNLVWKKMFQIERDSAMPSDVSGYEN